MKRAVAGAIIGPVLGLGAVLGMGLGMVPGAGQAWATPECDGAACVPYVDRTAALGGACNQSTRYNFGTDASGQTLACNYRGQWVAQPPLVGVRLMRLPCTDTGAVAQSPDGVPLKCDGTAWSSDFSVIFYR